jgi:hypothetical protein
VSRRWLYVSYDAGNVSYDIVSAVPTGFHLQNELMPRSFRSRATGNRAFVVVGPQNLTPNSDPRSKRGFHAPGSRLAGGPSGSSANKATLYPGMRSGVMCGSDVALRKCCGSSLSFLKSLLGAAFPRLRPLRTVHWRGGAAVRRWAMDRGRIPTGCTATGYDHHRK